VVIRHPHSGAPYLLARHLPQVSVVNAGDGLHAHPTQALLDLYTMREKLGTLLDAKVVIVGDVLHSRVARSNLWGLTMMGANVVLSGPTTLMPLDLLSGRDELEEDHPFARVDVDTDLDRAIVDASAVGFVKISADRKGKVMGATMVAHGAGDVIMPLVLAKTHGLSLSQVANTIFPYPTMVEGLKRASGEYMRSRLDTASGRTLKRVIKWLK